MENHELYNLASELNGKPLKHVLLLHAKYRFLEQPAAWLSRRDNRE